MVKLSMWFKVGFSVCVDSDMLIQAGNPYEPTMAVSGIDHTIKIFSPDANAQRNARKGIGVHSADRGLSRLGFGRRRRPRRPSATSPPTVPRDPSLSDDDDDNEVAENGLASRKAMHEQYQITSQNDMDRKGGELSLRCLML
jgi:nuclear receptor interaction protein